MVSVADPPSASARLSDQAVVAVGNNTAQQQDYTLTASGDLRRVGDVFNSKRRFRIASRFPLPAWLRQVVDQLNIISAAESNWDSYGALPINTALLLSAFNVLVNSMHDETPAPSLIPLSAGGLQIEWHQHGIDIEVEVTDPRQFLVFFRDRNRGKDWEGTVSNDDGQLRGFLSELTGRLRDTPQRAG